MIDVVLVDDHPVVLAGMRSLLSGDPGIRVVAVASSAAQARALEPEVAPDVCVVDLNLPDGDGVAVAAHLKERWPGARALVLTLDADPAAVLRALGAGLDGYLLKDADPAELQAAVRAASHGATVLGRGAGAPITAAALAVPDQGSSLAALSSRQRELLALVAADLGVQQIAARLYLSPKTVRNRLTDLVRALGVDSREAAAVLARAHGLGADPPP